MGAAMKEGTGTLLTLAGHFALMSLFAIGGAKSAVPEMHRLAVEVERWMTEQQFTDMFAIAQVTPGPNVIIVTLIGYHVAGFLGALQGRAMAGCHSRRIGANLDRPDRRQRLCGGIGGGAQFCGNIRGAGLGGRVICDALESPVDFCRSCAVWARRLALT
jgi:Chromate transporter